MKIIFTLLLTFLINLSVCALSYADNIAVIVGDSLITNLDVDQRMQIWLNSIEPQARPKVPLSVIRNQIIQSLIDEELLVQDAKKSKIEVPDEELKHAINNIEQANGLKPGEFPKFIKDKDLPWEGFIHQLRNQITISKIFNYKLRPKIDISSKEIEEVLSTIIPENAEANFKQVIIPISTFTNDDEVKNAIERLNKLRKKIKNCTLMDEVAKKEHLEVNNITLNLNKLHHDIRNMVRVLPIGNPSKVIKTASGLNLIVVCKRDYDGLNPTEKDEIKEMLIQKKMEKQSKHYINVLRQKTFIEIKS
jgi:peptidyl-prolyl cis-trans isomerase SurA